MSSEPRHIILTRSPTAGGRRRLRRDRRHRARHRARLALDRHGRARQRRMTPEICTSSPAGLSAGWERSIAASMPPAHRILTLSTTVRPSSCPVSPPERGTRAGLRRTGRRSPPCRARRRARRLTLVDGRLLGCLALPAARWRRARPAAAVRTKHPHLVADLERSLPAALGPHRSGSRRRRVLARTDATADDRAERSSVTPFAARRRRDALDSARRVSRTSACRSSCETRDVWKSGRQGGGTSAASGARERREAGSAGRAGVAGAGASRPSRSRGTSTRDRSPRTSRRLG